MPKLERSSHESEFSQSSLRHEFAYDFLISISDSGMSLWLDEALSEFFASTGLMCDR